MVENFQIRDLFNHNNITALGERILQSHPSFDLNAYLEMLIPAIDTMTYSERKNAITQSLEKFLPSSFETSVAILLKSLPPPYETNDIETSNDAFIVTAVTQYVSRNGLDFPELSMDAFYSMTKTCTAEWDVRPFVTRYPDYCKKVLLQWSKDENAHVRRLVSEGTRPYLPWGLKLHMVEKNPDWSIELLQHLKCDESLYVRRSVANHLNDLSKKHAEKVISVLTTWKNEHNTKEMSQLIKHALRTLIKRGNPGALQLLGFPTNVDIEIRDIIFEKVVPEEGSLTFSADIFSTGNGPQKILVDYAIHFQKANGTLKQKVFKLSSFELATGATKHLKRSFSFRPITTRKYYFGSHKLELLVNGKSRLIRDFKYGK